MQRLIDVLGTTRHRVIVSMGPRADELRLADNMTGAATAPADHADARRSTW